MKSILAPVLLSFAAACLCAQQYTVSTVAGGVPPQTPISALRATVANPWSIATDNTGNVFFASQTFHSVFKLDGNGVVTRAAGNGRSGYSGDGGPAVEAQLSYPSGLAFDSTGNLYIADGGNNCVRKLTPAGIITTYASPVYDAASVVVDSSGNLYAAGESIVQKISASGAMTIYAGNNTPGFSGDGGPATNAGLVANGIALDAHGNLFIADSYNHRIRMVSQTGTITTVAGNGSSGFSGDGGAATGAQLSFPQAVAVDGNGDLFIADTGNSRIREVTASGIISTLTGNGLSRYSGDGGPAVNATVATPLGLGLDSNLNLYIADTQNNRIRRVSPTGIITTVAGTGLIEDSGDNGPAANALLLNPYGVAIDQNGNVFISDGANRVRKITPTGTITTVAGNGTAGYSGDGGPATSAQLNQPEGIAVDASGALYIADYLNSRVRKVTTTGIISTVAGTGSFGYSGDGGPATNAQLWDPDNVATDSQGNLYIVDNANHRIRKVSAGGTITTVAGNGFPCCAGDNGPAVDAYLNDPRGLATDTDGNLYVAELLGSRVRKISKNGIITPFAGTGVYGSSGDGGPALNAQLEGPTNVTIDASGNFYIVDSNCIRKVTPDGLITTIAGLGINAPGYSGDGGPAVNAKLNSPNGIAVDAKGNVYFADTYNNAIRLLTPSCTDVSILTIPSGLPFSFDGGTSQSSPQQVCVAPGSHSIAVAETQAGGAGTRYLFNSWSDGGTAAHAVNITGPTTFTANLTTQYQLTTAASPSSAGSVTPASAPYYDAGTAVPISATANPGSIFSIWNGPVANSTAATTTVTMTAPLTITANFLSSVTGGGLQFVPVAPCRILDTRSGTAPFGSPAIPGGSSRDVPIPQGRCNIPNGAQAYSVNVTAVPSGPLAYLSIWPTGQAQPFVSTLNSFDGRVVANAAIVPAGAGGAVSIYASDTTNVVMDINGYFVPASSTNSLAFYPVSPCRLADTRSTALIHGGSVRSFAMAGAGCAIPSTASAFALNVTAVPHGPLGYLTIWPAGQSQPVVSTINSLDGSVVANAAIVPAGSNGAISVFVTDDTDVVIDVNGYFAAPGSPAGQALYTVAPCRVVDTRGSSSPSLAAKTPRDFDVAPGACNVPAAAQAYSLNVTVVPTGPLEYLTTWPSGQAQPYVSTLNSGAGKILANAAIIPAGTGGAISVFSTGATDLILDINGYFAH